MANNMDDLFANVKKMVDSGNIPDEVKQMMNNIQNNSNLSNMLNSNGQNSDFYSSSGQSGNAQNSPPGNSNFNLDIDTLMKMKSIMESMNNKNDPRANLLYSLKPYLRDSKKDKLDQYVNLLNVSKIAEFMNKNDGNKNKKT